MNDDKWRAFQGLWVLIGLALVWWGASTIGWPAPLIVGGLLYTKAALVPW